jgi:membrane protein
MRAFPHFSLQHGPLLSAGTGFRMFFTVTGLLATGFSVAGASALRRGGAQASRY